MPEPHDPSDPNAGRDVGSLDWDAVLGRTEQPPTSDRAASPSPADDTNRGSDAYATTRRSARIAEARREELSRADRSTRRRRQSEFDDTLSRERRPRGGWGCLIALVVIVGLLVAGFFAIQGPLASFMERFQPAPDYSGAGHGVVDFMIVEGDTGQVIAENLVDAGVTASFDAFYDLLLAEPHTFHPGVYRLAEEMSARAALDALIDPANKLENSFVIPEGTWANDALALAAEGTGIPLEELEAAATDFTSYGLPPEATSIEGFLFPATYTFDPDVSARDVVQRLVDRQFQALDEAGVPPEERYRTIVIASLIQREAGLRDDYYKVSRVILNRLDPAIWDGGLLQFDSAVHYGLGEDSVITTSDADRADPGNPYNTYVHPGLPPGPISNPGDLAIDAALNPAEGPWLYFVTVNLETGETVFSTTLAEHEAAVGQYLNWLAEHPEYGG